MSNFQPEDILMVTQQDGQSQITRLDADHVAPWLNDYTLGDLWKQNILKTAYSL